MVIILGSVTLAVREMQSMTASAKQCTLVQLTEAGFDRTAEAGPDPKLAVLGDSYAQGMYLASPGDSYAYSLGAPALVDGSGGSGYSAGGPCGSNRFIHRLGGVLALQPDTLIVQGGINDRGHADVGGAATSLFDWVENKSPSTRVVVVGPFDPPSAAGADLDAVTVALKGAAESRGLRFVDPRGWDFDVLSDGLHPSKTGHQQIAEKLKVALML